VRRIVQALVAAAAWLGGLARAVLRPRAPVEEFVRCRHCSGDAFDDRHVLRGRCPHWRPS
jgi:hypothetical protein